MYQMSEKIMLASHHSLGLKQFIFSNFNNIIIAPLMLKNRLLCNQANCKPIVHLKIKTGGFITMNGIADSRNRQTPRPNPSVS